MNCLIIDDDRLSRKLLEKFVEKTDLLDQYFSFSNAIDAINFLKKDQEDIDVIFLDIEMPDMNGVEFMQSIGDHPVQIIVVSSKEKYALDAIEYDVTDYLLKPVTYVRFLKATEKALSRLREEMLPSSSSKEDFFIRNNASLKRLSYDDVIWVEAMENYIVVNTFDDCYTIHFTMKAIMDQLPEDKFFRIHRSYIVNRRKIEFIKTSTIEVRTHEGIRSLPIGKSYRELLLRDINLLSK
ncbi:MAG: LytTR family DNA-binding domain-containing protein [Prolixibacteraceae bacterium]|jgi:DNA-binding LytR/AlgR family response regulator|nr:LytTR family DNA-binding domain-containing protein [Prolixibacteraceae bacterium]